MQNVTNVHLLIPANPFRPIQLGNWVTLDDKYHVLNCDLIEYIYPRRVHAYLHLAGDKYLSHISQYRGWVMIGDEEARLKDDGQPNKRATLLFGFPYDIMGDVLLICEDGMDGDLMDMSMIADYLQHSVWTAQ